MTPPAMTTMFSAPSALSCWISCGMRVRWPAAWLETPTTWTSDSTACLATSAGVRKSGPMSTSKPRSAKPVEMTLAPRSWPSWPILATRMRGRRPFFCSNCWTRSVTALRSSSRPDVLYVSLYTPCTTRFVATWRPKTDSIASVISPSVARALAATMAAASRFLLSSFAAAVTPSSAALTAAASRDALICARRSFWLASTCLLSILSTSVFCSDVGLYLLTPTMTSLPESMDACRRAADSSIRSLGMPSSMQRTMPPFSSTSSMIFIASATRSSVSCSIMCEPPHGSTTAGMPVSSCRMSCVLRAMRELNSVGSATASSNELVCSDWAPPMTAAIASTVVRTTLLYMSCSVSDHPDVCVCVRSSSDLGFLGLKCFFTSVAQSVRAARSFAISM
mmetsp:Transcript_6570/g.20628  ORF Transcript_6570/g.20628 Transcript_6570/m.20628 type:complete len:393 (-) Transcript_6570:96-1274(-)